MFVTDCKAKGDFLVRKYNVSPDEHSNQFASAEGFYVVRGGYLKPSVHSWLYWARYFLETLTMSCSTVLSVSGLLVGFKLGTQYFCAIETILEFEFWAPVGFFSM